MGSFANTVFSTLLGWVQNLVSVIWSALTSEDVNPFFLYLSKNWLKIAAVLCVVGLAVDFIVYFFRWRPYEVWRSFLHHIRIRKEPETEPDPVTDSDQPQRSLFQHSELSDAGKETDTDDLSRWMEPESKEHSGRIVPERAGTGYNAPEESLNRIPEFRNRRRRLRINQIFGDSQNEEDYHYVAPRPIMDQKDAYHAPVYPEKWTGSKEQDS